jgi:hypothetical protein
MNNPHQKQTVQRLSAVIIALFVLAAFSVLVVYLVDPSVYSKALMLEPATNLEVPATILQFGGVIPDPYPVWYSLYRMGIAVIQVGIAIWMVRIYFQYGVWGMGRRKHETLPYSTYL